MRAGLIVELHGVVGSDGRPRPSWSSIRQTALAAESAGFDSLVFEDALMYQGGSDKYGVWEAVAVAGAVAEATASIEFGPSVFNAVYRNPAMLANIAATLAEISGGRFIFGLGAGNTPDDYLTYGFPTDHRFSRFAEAVAIIHDMLGGGATAHSGEFWSTAGAELVFAHTTRPRLVIAAGGPKMIELAASYADEWNWWSMLTDPVDRIAAKVDATNLACRDIGRDPSTLIRSVDLYSIDESMSHSELSKRLARYRGLGFDEIRLALDSVDDDSTGPWVSRMANMVEVIHGLT